MAAGASPAAIFELSGSRPQFGCGWLGSLIVLLGAVVSVGAAALDWLVGEVEVGERRERLRDLLPVAVVLLDMVESVGDVVEVPIGADIVPSLDGLDIVPVPVWPPCIDPDAPAPPVVCASAGRATIMLPARIRVFNIVQSPVCSFILDQAQHRRCPIELVRIEPLLLK